MLNLNQAWKTKHAGKPQPWTPCTFIIKGRRTEDKWNICTLVLVIKAHPQNSCEVSFIYPFPGTGNLFRVWSEALLLLFPRNPGIPRNGFKYFLFPRNDKILGVPFILVHVAYVWAWGCPEYLLWQQSVKCSSASAKDCQIYRMSPLSPCRWRYREAHTENRVIKNSFNSCQFLSNVTCGHP